MAKKKADTPKKGKGEALPEAPSWALTARVGKKPREMNVPTDLGYSIEAPKPKPTPKPRAGGPKYGKLKGRRF